MTPVVHLRALFGTALLAFVLLLGAAAPALADTYPSKPIKLIVASAAGGPLDIVGRAVAEKLSDRLKQPVVSEIRSGAGGNIAADLVGKSPPDGYTLLLVLSTTLTVNPSLYKGVTFNLRPIAIINTATQLMVVHPSVPVNTLAEFVAWAKQNGPVTYGHAGNGTPSHLVMEYFRLRAGFETLPVPYRGSAPLVSDLLAGQFKAAFGATVGLIPQIAAGRLRPLAISSSTRSALAPDVPTVAESGYPGFNLETGFILLAPAGTPDEIVTLLEREVREALQAPDLRESFRKQDLRIVGSTPAEAEAFIKADTELWADVVKRTGMKAE
jgi:tripartite-type tricarboxylate transporter receptor subunit TctC